MRIPQGRSTTVAVLSAVMALGLALCLVLVMTVDRYGPLWWARLQGLPPPRAVPPVDPALANSGLRGNPALAFGPDSYPAEAIRAGREGRTVARLTVDATGTPVACTVQAGSGTQSLDDATCQVALQRIRFEPARDAKGRAIASHYTLPVRWVLPEQ